MEKKKTDTFKIRTNCAELTSPLEQGKAPEYFEVQADPSARPNIP